MNTLQDKLAKILSIKDERVCAETFESFCQEHADVLPMPGENSTFDKAMWAASKHTSLSKKDEAILKRVTGRLIAESKESVVKPVMAAAQSTVLKLKDLVGGTKEAAIGTWQDMLAAMQWQQMVPAGAMRGVGTQLVSLGTFQKQIEDATVQVNLGWLVDKDQLRVLLQAKDKEENALADVEVRVTEMERGVVFSRKTNEDGSVVAPSVQVGPGQYQIQVIWLDKVVETPFFKI